MKDDLHVLTDTLVHMKEVAALLSQAEADLRQRGVVHDLTKLQEPEFTAFVSNTPHFKQANYGTPEYAACVERIRPAIEHHHQNNRHHTAFHPNGVADMNLMDIIEMVADWRAAARRSPDLSFKEALPRAFKKYGIDETLQKLILNTIEYLGWE